MDVGNTLSEIFSPLPAYQSYLHWLAFAIFELIKANNMSNFHGVEVFSFENDGKKISLNGVYSNNFLSRNVLFQEIAFKEDSNEQLEGNYQTKWYDIDGITHQGNLIISRQDKFSMVYDFQWIESTGSIFNGIGLLHDTTIAVSYW